ncbi:MAG: DUF4377 domain-containing protein [Vicinamibacteria bacterium]
MRTRAMGAAAALCVAALAGCGGAEGPTTADAPAVLDTTPAIDGTTTVYGTPLGLGREETLFIADTRVTCHGPFPRQCLQSGPSISGPWTVFYEFVAGFDWVPGYVYELRVHVSHVANPPADASTRYFQLVRVVSRTAVPPSL